MPHIRRLARKPSTAFAALLLHGRDATAFTHALPLATGRAAFEIGLRALGVRPGARVLLPEYICDVMLVPFQRLNLRPLYYELDDHLSPDWESLEKMLPSAEAAVLLHPFGQPQDSVRFGTCCGQQGVLFVEDNAHGWGAERDGQPLGTFGDMGFASPWKQYAIPHGAFLYLRPDAAFDEALRLCTALSARWVRYVAPFFKSRLRALLTLTPQLRLRYMRPTYLPEVAAASVPEQPQKMSPSVAGWLAQQRPAADAARRRAVYRIWETWTSAAGLRPVFPALHAGAAPLCFPAYAPDCGSRDDWLRWGWLHDMAVHTWPTLPENLRVLSRIMDRWNRLVCFPIHQEVDSHELSHLLHSLTPPC